MTGTTITTISSLGLTVSGTAQLSVSIAATGALEPAAGPAIYANASQWSLFNQGAIVGGTGAVGIYVASGTANGTSTITIGGTSGSLTASTTIQLTISTTGPVVTLNPTSIVFPTKKVGVTSGAKKVTVTNSGTAVLNISSIATTGDFALFSFTSPKKCGSTLAAGKSCIVKVTFTPTQTGLRTGSLNFTDNAPGSPQSVALSGTGK